jgi:ABC-type cobalt transport system substrate-binding protein
MFPCGNIEPLIIIIIIIIIALYQAVIKADKKYTPVDLANENLVINIKTK